MEDDDKEVIRKDITEILNKTIHQNGWETLMSSDYGEYFTVTEIGKEIIIDNKKLSAKKLNIILEEIGFIKRNGKKIVLTEKGKEFGRYAISINIHSKKNIITDSGYAKYKKTVISKIKEYLEVKSILEENQKSITFKISKEPIELESTPEPINYSVVEEEKENETK